MLSNLKRKTNDKMKANSKVKLFIVLAISLIALLLTVSVWQLVEIHKKQNELNAKQAEVERLADMLEYYKEHKDNQTSDGSEILEGEH